MSRTISAVPCHECPLLDCRGLRPLEQSQIDYMQQYKSGELRIDDGELIIEQGMHVEHLYTLLEGIMIRYRTMEDGRRQVVNFLFPGDLIGLQAAFDDKSSHSIEALENSFLCVFSSSKFENLLKQHPRLAYDVVWLAAKDETQLEDHLVALGQRRAKERVAYLAVWLLDRAINTGVAGDGNSLKIPITQAQIADMLGLSLVHANRTIKALQRDGLIQWRPGELTIPDMDAAAKFAHYDPAERNSRPYI